MAAADSGALVRAARAVSHAAQLAEPRLALLSRSDELAQRYTTLFSPI